MFGRLSDVTHTSALFDHCYEPNSNAVALVPQLVRMPLFGELLFEDSLFRSICARVAFRIDKGLNTFCFHTSSFRIEIEEARMRCEKDFRPQRCQHVECM